MTIRGCTSCDWKGYFPGHYKREQRVNGVLVIKVIEIYPVCGCEKLK